MEDQQVIIDKQELQIKLLLDKIEEQQKEIRELTELVIGLRASLIAKL
jgi:hypothetical protein